MLLGATSGQVVSKIFDDFFNSSCVQVTLPSTHAYCFEKSPFDEQIILKKRNTAFVLPRLLSASSKNEKTIASSEDVESKIKRLEFRCIE